MRKRQFRFGFLQERNEIDDYSRFEIGLLDMAENYKQNRLVCVINPSQTHKSHHKPATEKLLLLSNEQFEQYNGPFCVSSCCLATLELQAASSAGMEENKEFNRNAPLT